MRYINTDLQEISLSDIDLTKGMLIDYYLEKADITPVDNINKFVYEPGDLECVKMFVPMDLSTMISPEEDQDAMLVDLEYRLTLVELGI